ncbi:MAG: thiamine pyrophosphate-dependent enzyme [Thermoplasmata archaeon]|nr:thiamine pyrophosphate-dependent enzyme [Thermoplasmata archaeon]
MSRILVESPSYPYCPGCTHTTAAVAIARALEAAGTDPLDVVVVTDIGCCGIIDPLLACHTVHGLHGRAVALGMGIRLGIEDPRKRVVVIQGDGGATIGLQHLLEASRLNVDMTVIVLNNMVYGMTGGQASGLSAREVREMRGMGDGAVPPYDLCSLAHAAGAAYSARVLATGDLQARLSAALAVRGLSLVEAVGICHAYGIASREDLERLAAPETVLVRDREPYSMSRRELPSLLDGAIRPRPSPEWASLPGTRLGVVIAGSAGEGVQIAAELLASAGIAIGLRSTKKGEYPITVGKGFSTAEVILSSDRIEYSAIERPDVVIVTSKEGMDAARGMLGNAAALVLDDGLEVPGGFTGTCMSAPFRKAAGAKGAALCALAYWLAESGVMPLEALEEVAGPHRHAVELRRAIESSRTCAGNIL